MNDKLRKLVNKDLDKLVSLIKKYFKHSTIILWGSFYYDEPTAYLEKWNFKFFSDYDIFVVFNNYNPLSFTYNFLKLKKFKIELKKLKKTLNNDKVDLNFIWKPLVNIGLQRGINEGKVLVGNKYYIKKQEKKNYFRDADLLYKLLNPDLVFFEQSYTNLLLSNPFLETHNFIEKNYSIIKIILQSMELIYLKLSDKKETHDKKTIYEEFERKKLFSNSERKLYKKCLEEKINPQEILSDYNLKNWFKARDMLNKTLFIIFRTKNKKKLFEKISKQQNFLTKIKNFLLTAIFLVKNKTKINPFLIKDINSRNIFNKFNLVNSIEKPSKINENSLKEVEKNMFKIRKRIKRTKNIKQRFLFCLEETMKYKKENPLEIKL
ncbi:hypothetical protein CMO90_01000 [Candidatus Woesearchaeota archaeon]|jgi:hypothetical protein|nr:hypothetical protein [Candidatus Woesearchaeota archaeon]|tara:strand:+ start:1333 stop:2466 length:1134 start_codon:yes stop_codon:yes gene_type:complete